MSPISITMGLSGNDEAGSSSYMPFKKYRQNLFLILIADICLMLVIYGESSILQQFCEFTASLRWTSFQVQLYTSVYAVGDALTLILLLPLVLYRWHWRPTTIAVCASASRLGQSAIQALPHLTTAMMYAAGAVGALKYAAVVYFRTIAASLVDSDESGRLFALVAIGELVGQLLASLIFTSVFSATGQVGSMGQWSGFVFVVAALISTYPLFASVVLHVSSDGEARTTTSPDQQDDTKRDETPMESREEAVESASDLSASVEDESGR